ncbi:Spo11/DNA topoisomerase VI subunit A [Mycena haematopus]|nr:Spo11/DNA topoisomerase VI subunit A [Mycena haematopus]
MFSDYSDEEQTEESIPSATECIEDLVTSFLFQLSRTSGSKPAGSDSESEDASAKTTPVRTPLELRLADRRGEGTLRTMRFPVKRATGSARPFAQLFRVLDLVHEAVVDTSPQRNACDLQGTRLRLGPGHPPNSGERLHATDTEGTLIPVGEDIKTFTVADDVEWVLLVEKDAIFQTLCRVRFASHAALSGRGLIITGKGYPDVATRQLVATLSACLPRRIPLLGLVDGDPYGIDILSVYKYGVYLGVLASELASFGVDRDALLPITKADEKKALTMLGRPIPAKWRCVSYAAVNKPRHSFTAGQEGALAHAARTTQGEIEVLASAGAPGRRDGQMEVMSDIDPPSTSQSTSSGPSWDTTPPTSQGLDAPPENALVRYLVAKIRDYVERARRGMRRSDERT